MSLLLPKLTSKKEVDQAIKSTAEKVLVLRFGRDEDPVCLQIDDILSKTSHDLSKMAMIYLVDVDQTPIYTQYFDISYIPSTVFFFNGQHMKVDYGSPDHTKFVGSFKTKQDFIDLVEVIYRGAMRGKLIVQSPIDPKNIPNWWPLSLGSSPRWKVLSCKRHIQPLNNSYQRSEYQLHTKCHHPRHE
uniref:Thioredoxin-like protein 4B n=1 Tax=Monodelphis domestica TaxID=13616 RepID=F7B9Q6_MONDO